MPDADRKRRAIERYEAAAHGMQSGVAFDLERGDQSGTPKHLRVGINAAMADHGALVTLLMAKGLFTEIEYLEALADAMEAERKRYQQHLGAPYGLEVTLG